jgi:hypothetical protein
MLVLHVKESVVVVVIEMYRIEYRRISLKPYLFLYFYSGSNLNMDNFEYEYKCSRIQIRIAVCRIRN